ncbi:MAG: DinB family protein [Winogradskyella sp.]|uniref:DinB family protein n=1 Tax=Winogradskyella sp. TaxID=1883156 RepID=UPI000F3E98A1|nr:DinB family protein [Winogradskyella sp.]RNC86398.1 MAG: DinB family protein [Winogradskyella sp.]
MVQSLIKLFHRDLDAVKKELNAYNNETVIWKVDKSVSNCSGNLALHLVGNLNHFIGATLGNTGYIRQRDLEFSQKDVPVNDIIAMLDDTKTMIANTLNKLSDEDLQKEYRRNPFEDYMTTAYFLLHLKSHLAYHLGQINYHRRLLD